MQCDGTIQHKRETPTHFEIISLRIPISMAGVNKIIYFFLLHNAICFVCVRSFLLNICVFVWNEERGRNDEKLKSFYKKLLRCDR